MLNNSYICALDIGSSKLSAAVAVIKKRHVANIFLATLPSKGVKDGVIVDSIELVSCIGKLLKSLKEKSGINIKYINTNVSGKDIVTKHSRAILPLAERGNKVISASDIQRVNEQARVLGSSLEEDIIHMEPSSYAIDSKSNLSNPLGLYSHRLEVDLYLICGKLSSIQSLARVINQSGYEIKDLFFSGLATSRAAFTQDLKDGINLVCDIGSDITELLVFRQGLLCDIEILPFGGDSLTGDLQDNLQIPFELAEEIKRSYGMVGDTQQLSEDKEILLKKEKFYKPIKQKLVAEIISAKAKTLCSNIKEAVEKKVSCYEVNNFIVTGRTVLLEGFIETLENTLSIPVKLGRLTNLEILSVLDKDLISGQKYLNYLTCLGMLSESLESKPHIIKSASVSAAPQKNIFKKAVGRVKEVYQEYF